MSASNCGMPTCPLPVAVGCRCSGRLAELCAYHHFKFYPDEDHSLPCSPLSDSEHALLDAIESSLRWRVSAQQSSFHLELQIALKPILEEFDRLNKQCSHNLQTLLNHYSAVKESLAWILKTRVVGDTDPFSSALFKQRNRGPLTMLSVERILKHFQLPGKLWATASDEFIVSAEANHVCFRSLHADLGYRGSAFPVGAAVLSATPQHVVIAGGQREREVLSQVAAVYPACGERLPLRSLNTPRTEFALAKDKHSIVAIGGYTPDGVTNTCEILGSKGWMPFASLNIKRAGHSACSLDESIYVAGGYHSVLLDSIEKLGSSGWRVLRLALPTPCRWPGLMADHNCILVAGGLTFDYQGNQRLLDTVAVANPRKSTWLSRTSLIQPLCFSENTWIKQKGQAYSFGTYWSTTNLPQKMQITLTF